MRTVLKSKTVRAAILGAAAGVLLSLAAGLVVFHGPGGLWAGVKLAGVLRVFDREFVTDYDMEKVTDSVMAGAVSGLGDRWSYYMTAEEYADFQDYASNRYQGIGVTIQKDEETGGFFVVSVNRDGPAQLAGITAGDIILAVDGVSVIGEDMEAIRERIRADFGQTALITVRREDGTEEEIPVSCESIYSTPVRSEMLDGNVGLITIANFREGSADDAIAASEELMAQGAKRLLFDVRNNPGGQLTELCALLDYLLPEGDLFVRTDRRGRETIDTSDESCVDLPMAVLVNGDSYSAAEFFAAALQEYEWATVLGEPTTGKGRSQVTVPLVDGSAVHLSKFSYLTPKRADLFETGGIVPDVVVELTEEERGQLNTGRLEPEDDPQIQAAIDRLCS